MASIFDFDDNIPPLQGASTPLEDPESKSKKKSKRSKVREQLTPSELAEGKETLKGMVDVAFRALEEAVRYADHNISIKAAQIILDRAGFGPKTTVDVNTTTVDLSNLSKDELAERALKLSQRLKATGTDGKVVPIAKSPTVN